MPAALHQKVILLNAHTIIHTLFKKSRNNFTTF